MRRDSPVNGRRRDRNRPENGRGPSFDVLSRSVEGLEYREGETSTAAHDCVEDDVVPVSFSRGRIL